ncbi:unnamed protein product [Mytilus edulis]|uniref:Uncharacterized protein n=1 Tax=Mytilus edulis TaxID=6550 RepID=A0A8S3SUA2_MYTED|nr:unnamed protein product [Mytilus edulis]
MAEKDSTLDWTGTDKSDHLLTPEAELIPEGRAQGSRLPTSVQHDFIDATPSGEVQVRVKMRDERQVMGNIRPNKNADNLILMEEPINGGAASGDGTAAGSVTRECTVNQQVSHGRGDKFSGYFADSSVQDRFGDQRFSHQRENFSSPVFTKGQVPMDVEGASILQGISQGPQWTNAMPSGGMRVNPWKVRTGTEDPIECNGHARESSRIVSGYEDVLGYRDVHVHNAPIVHDKRQKSLMQKKIRVVTCAQLKRQNLILQSEKKLKSKVQSKEQIGRKVRQQKKY